MLGGGTFTAQNKVLPGAYINFVSAQLASATISDRGVAAIPLELDWGPDGAVFAVTSEDFQTCSLKIFGYDYSHAKLKYLRDLFRNIRLLYAYKLNSAGVQATCVYGTAKYKGTRGNDLNVVITTNIDDAAKKDVALYLGTTKVDSQTVATAAGLVSNDFVTWNSGATLTVTAGTPFTGGTNGAAVTGTDYQTFLSKIEVYSINTIGCPTADPTTNALFVAFAKRMRDEVGVKLQAVVYRTAADYEGVVSVENTVTDAGANPAAMVYWVTGALAGCDVNKSVTNKTYRGEFAVDTSMTQRQLQAALQAGKFVIHRVGETVKVLSDVNTLTTLTADKGADFQGNQTIRVLDQIANDTAVLFNTRYLGIIPNDAAGRLSLWNDLVNMHKALEQIRAIENFKAADITVDAGANKKSVVVGSRITVVNAMEKLYMIATIA